MARAETPLIEQFQQYFSVQLAQTPAQKADVYRIRYRVYCEQFAYEPAERFPDGEEFDEFDDRSLHCLVVHKGSGQSAGCVRLVSTDGDMDTDPLPFEKFCRDSLDTAMIEALDLDRSTVCEISRLAVDGDFRRRSGEGRSRYGGSDVAAYSEHERRTFPLICISAFLAAIALGEVSGRTNGFAMMEPFLPRMLRRSGILVDQVGDEVDYHGRRAPYFSTRESAIADMQADLKAMYAWILAQMHETYTTNA